VVRQLVELQHRGATGGADGSPGDDDRFAAEQNALVVRDAETYYRAMFRGGAESWNVRDRHMMRSLEALLDRARRKDRPARAVVWAHNSHLGDARATTLADIGELNLGQLVRERFPGDAVIIGMTTHDGTVTAAHRWDEPAEQQAIRPSLPESYERVFHDAALGAFVLDLRAPAVADALAGPRLQRAIGVIYRPATERASHYIRAWLPRQFDVVVHLDRTSPVVPLDAHDAPAPAPDLPDTFPSGV
jgi:erythromycin esterase-like protein